MRSRLDGERDVRGIIGLFSVVGLFGIVFVQLLRATPIAIPPEVAGVVGSVVGFYFGSKGAAGSVEQAAQGAAQGVKLDTIHELVNSRFNDLVEVNKVQAEKISEQRQDARDLRTAGKE